MQIILPPSLQAGTVKHETLRKARRHQDINSLSVQHPICCGLNVYKEKISVCLICMDKQEEENYQRRE